MADIMESLVRQNLMQREGYSPYCGAAKCSHRWPRTVFDGEQFKCDCGWRSSLEADFIKRYKEQWGSPKTTADQIEMAAARLAVVGPAERLPVVQTETTAIIGMVERLARDPSVPMERGWMANIAGSTPRRKQKPLGRPN